MSTIKLSTGVERIRQGAAQSALTMGPELKKLGPFQIVSVDTVEYGDTSFETLMSDKGVSFSFSSLFGAAVKGSTKKVWENILEAADKTATLKQIQDKEEDIDVPLADLNFAVTEAEQMKSFDGRVLHTVRSYTGYQTLLKQKQEEIKNDQSKTAKDIPTFLNTADLSQYEKSVIYQSELVTDGTARPLYSLEVEMIES